MFKKSPKSNVFLLILLIILILILGNLFPSQRRAFLFFFSAPIQKMLWQAGERISEVLRFSPSAKLREENKALWLENQSLKAEVLALKGFEEENKKIKEALETGLQKEFSLVPVHAIGLAPFEDVLFLDKGTRDSLARGMPVISSQKVLYGFIEEVFERSSRIRLLSHRESSVIVYIAEDGVSGVVKGQGGGAAILDLIPRGVNIKEGSLILSAPQETYPRGLLVGLVGKGLASDREPFLQTQAQLFFEEMGFRSLFVITDF